MKILQIFGAVIAVHVLAFLIIFATPGCQSTPRNIPTPDATVPTGGASTTLSSPSTSGIAYTPVPVDPNAGALSALATQGGRTEPTRPGSPNAAVLTPSRPAAEVAPVSTYTVVRGDSLWSIAKKNRLTVAELAKANNLSTGATLQPGKKLIIPGKPAEPQDLSTAAAPAKSDQKAATPARSAEAVKHRVASGESLGTIARRYQVTVGELAAANNITDPAKIRAGQELIIPGFRAVNSGAATRPATSTPGNTTSPSSTSPGQAPTEAEPTVTTPRFELTPPPPGQDLDAGLKETTTDVPTIKVEDPRTPPKG